MLILKVGYILDTGFEQVLVFDNAAVYDGATSSRPTCTGWAWAR
jgi:ABC-type polysaccharide transport system permease subunit